MFVGRESQLARLDSFLQRVRADRDGKPGRALLIRGRRRVGKSRLVEEFVDRAGVPSLFFAAAGRPVRDELRLFAEEVAASNLPGAGLFVGVELSSWDAALRLLATALPKDGSVVVFDQLPYLIEADEHFEGTLQRAFDRELSRRRQDPERSPAPRKRVRQAPAPARSSCDSLCCRHHHGVVEPARYGIRDQWEVRIALDGLPEFPPPARCDPERRPIRNRRHIPLEDTG